MLVMKLYEQESSLKCPHLKEFSRSLDQTRRLSYNSSHLNDGRRSNAMSGDEDNLIERITENRQPHFEPYGWHHWPEHPWLAYQFRRGLGGTQEGGGTVSECFQAASRMIPGDKESWHREWMRVADGNQQRGLTEEQAGHIRT